MGKTRAEFKNKPSSESSNHFLLKKIRKNKLENKNKMRYWNRK
jgi:hypothetical protein